MQTFFFMKIFIFGAEVHRLSFVFIRFEKEGGQAYGKAI